MVRRGLAAIPRPPARQASRCVRTRQRGRRRDRLRPRGPIGDRRRRRGARDRGRVRGTCGRRAHPQPAVRRPARGRAAVRHLARPARERVARPPERDRCVRARAAREFARLGRQPVGPLAAVRHRARLAVGHPGVPRAGVPALGLVPRPVAHRRTHPRAGRRDPGAPHLRPAARVGRRRVRVARRLRHRRRRPARRPAGLRPRRDGRAAPPRVGRARRRSGRPGAEARPPGVDRRPRASERDARDVRRRRGSSRCPRADGE